MLLAAATGLVGGLAVAPAGAQQGSEGEGLRGELEDNDEPVAGVDVIVSTPDGEEVATATSDEDGAWAVELPGPGEYLVELDVDTLPEEVGLRDPDRNPLEAEVREGQERRLVFALGESTRDTTETSDRALELFVDGIRFGLIIAMAAIGLSLVYGTTGMVNFAHGEYVTFGAMVAFFFNASVAGPELQLIPATLLALVVGGLLAGALEVGLWRPLRRRHVGVVTALVVSIGLALFLRHLLLFVFGGARRPFTDYQVQETLDLGPLAIAPKDLWTIGLAIVVLVAVGLGLLYTRFGVAMRAVADNRDLASACGIDVQRVILMVWIAGGALAALGGVLVGVADSVDWNMGFRLLLLIFAGVIVGGLTSPFGALAGSLAVGIIIQMSTLVAPSEIKSAFALGALVLVLLVRPQGILGRAERTAG